MRLTPEQRRLNAKLHPTEKQLATLARFAKAHPEWKPTISDNGPVSGVASISYYANLMCHFIEVDRDGFVVEHRQGRFVRLGSEYDPAPTN